MEAYIFILTIFLGITALKSIKNIKPFDTKITLPLRGILALGIILHHTSMTFAFKIPEWSIFKCFSTMGSPIVALFFFLTGYGLCVSLAKKGENYIKGFLKKRYSSFIPEFIFLSFSMIGILWLFYDEAITSSLSGFITAKNTPLPNSWFIYAIIFVYAAFFFAAKICKGNVIKTGWILASLILLYIITMAFFGYAKFWFNSIPSVLLGYTTAYLELRPGNPFKTIKRHWLLFLAGLFLLCLTLLPISISKFVEINFSALAIYFLIRIYGFPQWKWLCFLGTISLNIYLIHGIIIKWTPKEWNYYISYIFICVATIILAATLNSIRNKFLIKRSVTPK